MQVKEMLNDRLKHLRPILKAAGRKVEVQSVDGDTVTFLVSGFCSGCACSSSYKEGLEELVGEACPNIEKIKFVEN